MAAPHGASNLDYSNLEVVQSPPESNLAHGTGIEVASYQYGHEHNDKQAVFLESNPASSPIARPPSKDEKILNPYYDVPEAVGDQQHTILPPPPPTICGVRRKVFWIVMGVIIFVVVAGAIGGGVGGYFASRSKETSSGSVGSGNSTDVPSTPRAPFQNLSIAALRWVDPNNVSQYRLYSQPAKQTHIMESAWSSDTKNWTVSPITEEGIDTVKAGTSIAASAGHPHTNTSLELVKTVFYFQPGGMLIERQSPYKEKTGVWGNDNFSGLYSVSMASSVFSYWYQNLDTHLQVLVTFFQELGANSLTVARYVENGTDGRPWESSKQSISIQDGSPIAAAPVGSRRDLRLYVGGADGTMKQYPYNIEKNTLGTVVSTAFDLSPRTPLCVTIEDNRNWYSDSTLPECARTNTGAFITHLLLFATADRQNLTLVSWNCSSGFVVQQNRIEKLLKPNRTYLGLTTTSASNLTFVDQRVYVLFDEGTGPEVEEWQVPPSGGADKAQQNGAWKFLGNVPTKPS